MARLALIMPEELFQLEIGDLCRIWDELPWTYQVSLVYHPQAPSLFLWHAAKSNPDWALRIAGSDQKLAEDLACDLILHLALDFRHCQISGPVARNPSLTEDMLTVLTDLGGLDARYALVYTQGATEAVLERLARDPHREIRMMARRSLRAMREGASSPAKDGGG